MPKYYDGASDSMEAPFEPKTPCRNMETRPCVFLTHDDRQRFPVKECLPHYCTRFGDQYTEPNIPHHWKLSEDGAYGSDRGDPEYFEIGDNHGGPYCLRCELTFCQYCDPKIWTKTCGEQDAYIF